MANLGLEESSLVSASFLVAQEWAHRYSETSPATRASLLNSIYFSQVNNEDHECVFNGRIVGDF
jgi:hypothetical protein